MASRLIRARLSPEDHAKIEYIPFWEPDVKSKKLLEMRDLEFLYRPMSKARHLYILQDVKRLTEYFGLQARWPLDSASPWWERPHLAYIAAADMGKGQACRDALYRERWEKGHDICDAATIERIAEEIDIPPRHLLNAPENIDHRQAGVEALAQCIAAGAFGVPFFVANHDKFWGVDRLDFFLEAVKKSGLHPLPAIVPSLMK